MLGYDAQLYREADRHFREYDGPACDWCGKALDIGYETTEGLFCYECAWSLAVDMIEADHEGEEHEYELCDVYEDEIDELMDFWEVRLDNG